MLLAFLAAVDLKMKGINTLKDKLLKARKEVLARARIMPFRKCFITMYPELVTSASKGQSKPCKSPETEYMGLQDSPSLRFCAL